MSFHEYSDGATALDPDEIDGLLLRHITTREELNRWEQENIAEAEVWLRSRRTKGTILNEDFIQSLHWRMFGKIWSWAGEFRRSNKNIGVEWVNVPVALRSLLEDVQFWIENNTYESNEIAARFHHRLVQIHLFPNGNGRHARLMADTLLTEKLNLEPFTWGSRSAADAVQLRSLYIAALRAAHSVSRSDSYSAILFQSTFVILLCLTIITDTSLSKAIP